MELGIYPSKRFGQTFLIDESIADREIESARIRSKDTVLEIGPGLGVLTERIVQKARRVVAIENDQRLAIYLREKFGDAVEVVEGDAMDAKLPKFDVAIGNLPYSVSSQLIFRLVNSGMKRGLFMIQKEMALRVVAPPFTAEYSRMAAVLQRSNHIELLFDVGHTHFYPQPDVDSSVLRFVAIRGGEEMARIREGCCLTFLPEKKDDSLHTKEDSQGWSRSGRNSVRHAQDRGARREADRGTCEVDVGQ